MREERRGVQIPLLRGLGNLLFRQFTLDELDGDRKDGLRWIRELDEMSVWKKAVWVLGVHG